MHSLAMAENILKAVISEAEKHNGKRVESIEVCLDAHGFLEADSVQFCFESLARGTVAEGATIEIKQADIEADGSVPSITLQLS